MAKKTPRKERNKQQPKPVKETADYGPEELLNHHTAPKVWDYDHEAGKLVLHRKNMTQRVIDRYYNRGFISDRQHNAAKKLMRQFEVAGFHAVVGVNLLGSGIAGSGSPSWMIPVSEAAAEERRKIRVIFAELGGTIGKVLIAVIQDDRDILDSMSSIKNAPQKRASLVGMVKISLDALADHYGLPHKS